MIRFYLLDVLIIAISIWDISRSYYDREKKILWIFIVILVPVFGALAWFLVSRKIINL